MRTHTEELSPDFQQNFAGHTGTAKIFYSSFCTAHFAGGRIRKETQQTLKVHQSCLHAVRKLMRAPRSTSLTTDVSHKMLCVSFVGSYTPCLSIIRGYGDHCPRRKRSTSGTRCYGCVKRARRFLTFEPDAPGTKRRPRSRWIRLACREHGDIAFIDTKMSVVPKMCSQLKPMSNHDDSSSCQAHV